MYKYPTGGLLRVPLASPKVIGVANSRGNRRLLAIPYFLLNPIHDRHFSHQEDFYSFATLNLDPVGLRESVKKAHGLDWDPKKVGDASGQVVFVGIYDGCGFSLQYLIHAYQEIQAWRIGGVTVFASRTSRHLRVCR